jgi:CRP-like cAMP-binding protein
MPARPHCAYCPSRHSGLCLGVADDDAAAIAALEAARSPIRLYDPGDIIYAQGDKSGYLFNLVSGWICLHRDMTDGRRQIIRFMVPGASFGVAPSGEDLDHTATVITSATVCQISNKRFDELRSEFPSVNERFIQLLEQEIHSAAKALTTLGLGTAKERIGGLLRDLSVMAIGEDSIRPGVVLDVPLTQRHIAEATGLTSIHVNRILRLLREDRVVDLREGKLTIIDAGKLRRITEPGANWRWDDEITVGRSLGKSDQRETRSLGPPSESSSRRGLSI